MTVLLEKAGKSCFSPLLDLLHTAIPTLGEIHVHAHAHICRVSLGLDGGDMSLLREHGSDERLGETLGRVVTTSSNVGGESGIVMSEVLLMLSDLSLVLLDLLQEQKLLRCPRLSRVLSLRNR